MAKFGPFSNSDCCAGMSGLADRLITHLFLEQLVVSVMLLFGPDAVDVVVEVVDCLLLLLLWIIGPFYLCHCCWMGGIYYWFESYGSIHFFQVIF